MRNLWRNKKFFLVLAAIFSKTLAFLFLYTMWHKFKEFDGSVNFIILFLLVGTGFLACLGRYFHLPSGKS